MLPLARYCLWRAVAPSIHARSRTKWRTTTGEVLGVTVREPVANARMQAPFERTVSYGYTVGTERYAATSAATGDDPLQRGLWTRRQWADEYRVGQPLQVWYDPQHPDHAALALSASARSRWMWWWVAVALVLNAVVTAALVAVLFAR